MPLILGFGHKILKCYAYKKIADPQNVNPLSQWSLTHVVPVTNEKIIMKEVMTAVELAPGHQLSK